MILRFHPESSFLLQRQASSSSELYTVNTVCCRPLSSGYREAVATRLCLRSRLAQLDGPASSRHGVITPQFWDPNVDTHSDRRRPAFRT